MATIDKDGKYEKLVPLETRQFVEACIEKSRTLLEEHGALSPLVFVGKFSGGGVVIPDMTADTKDIAARAIRRAAAEIDADYVLHIDEVWLATAKTQAEYSDLRKQYGQVRDMPGRIDAVMFNLETRMGQFMGTAIRVTRENAGPKDFTFGDVEFTFMDGASGRFVGMLPVRGSRQ